MVMPPRVKLLHPDSKARMGIESCTHLWIQLTLSGGTVLASRCKLLCLPCTEDEEVPQAQQQTSVAAAADRNQEGIAFIVGETAQCIKSAF